MNKIGPQLSLCLRLLPHQQKKSSFILGIRGDLTPYFWSQPEEGVDSFTHSPFYIRIRSILDKYCIKGDGPAASHFFHLFLILIMKDNSRGLKAFTYSSVSLRL